MSPSKAPRLQQPKAYKRWSQNSEAGKFSRASVAKGDMLLSSLPKAIYDSNPVFSDHALDSVCTHIDFLRSKKGEKVIEMGEQRNFCM